MTLEGFSDKVQVPLADIYKQGKVVSAARSQQLSAQSAIEGNHSQ